MTPPIRPGLTPLPSPAPQRSAQALAAQRAFFQQALAQAGQPAAPSVPSPAVQTTASMAKTTASEPTADSEPLPRLGRYLDIRV